MKEIRAYVREKMANHVIEQLEKHGCLDFAILEVRGITSGLAKEAYDFSVSLGQRFERLVKFEVICRDANAERIAALVRTAASTGHEGDGMVFIAPVDDAIRISSGARGEGELREVLT